MPNDPALTMIWELFYCRWEKTKRGEQLVESSTLDPLSRNIIIWVTLIILITVVPSYRRSILIQPTTPEIYNNLGSSYVEMGLINKGLNHLTRALQMRPAYSDALDNLSLLLQIDRNLPK